METYQLIREAIEKKQQVLATYRGRYREMCPHTLGTKRGKLHALFYQFGGTTSKGPVGDSGSWGSWKCMDIDDLVVTEIREGEWHTGPRHSQPQTCVNRIDVEVSY